MRLVRYLSEGRLERDDGVPTRRSVGTPYLVFRYLNLRSRLKGRRAEREPFALSRLLDLTWCYPCASHLDKLVRATVYILSDILDGIAPCRQIPMVRSDTVRYLIVSHATSVSVSTILFSKPRIVTDENRTADFFVKLQTFLRIRM